MNTVGNSVENKILQAANIVENEIDEEIRKLDNLDQDDLEKIRNNRINAMKQQAKLREEYLSKGHGEYTELPEEKDFFEVTKKSERVVAHFYKSDAPRCKIFDHHLKILARSHIETRFIKMDAEKCPFLADRLHIKVIPTLLIVVESKTRDRLIGFQSLGNCDDFSTEMLEWRLAVSSVINYDGDIRVPPDEKKDKKKKQGSRIKKSIRDCSDDSDDDDDY